MRCRYCEIERYVAHVCHEWPKWRKAGTSVEAI
uniref:Uncharacterized protein n=1 Tax=Setaria viridis TaxID=4556 RepID=A0A4U6VZM9_SETVI|nr:hypothetical protein SEVIR_2G324150v2 [Setaria viridis]